MAKRILDQSIVRDLASVSKRACVGPGLPQTITIPAWQLWRLIHERGDLRRQVRRMHRDILALKGRVEELQTAVDARGTAGE